MRWPVVLALSLALNLLGWSLFGLWLGGDTSNAQQPTVELSVVHLPPPPVVTPPQVPEIKPVPREASTPKPRPQPRPLARRPRPRPRPQPRAQPRAAPPAPKKVVAVKSIKAPSSESFHQDPPTATTRAPTPVLRRVAAPAPARRIAPPPAPARKGPDLAALRARIRHAVNRHRHYPRQARRRGLEGRVILRFRLSPQGGIRTVRIVRSAGRLLDKAAVAALRRATPLPYYPDWVRLPVVFQLED